MKTRYLFVTRTWSRGGAEKHLQDLIARLDSSCSESVVACLESDQYSEFLKACQGVTVRQYGGCSPASLLSYWLLFREHRADIILFVNGWLGLFPWYAYVAARTCGARRVMAVEHLVADVPERVRGGGVLNSLRRMLGYHARALWRIRLGGLLSHKIVAVSNAVRDMLIREYGYPSTKTVTVLNGVDLRYYARSTSTPPGDKRLELGFAETDDIVLCISNLNAQKRIDVLLEAFCQVAAKNPHAKCVILGSGDLEATLRRKAVQLNLEGSVIFKGHVRDVRPYLEVADLFVMSSDKEGLSLSLGEAMAYGIPCIATDVGGNKEIVAHDYTGLLVEPRSPDQLAVAICKLLAQPEERRRMGVNALLRVREEFNIEASMKRFMTVLLEQAG